MKYLILVKSLKQSISGDSAALDKVLPL